jgi:hypothetical protein
MDEHRPPFGGMTEEEIEELVGRVSQRVLNGFYTEIGKSVVKKALWVIGLATISLLIYLTGAGKFKVFQ